MKLLRTWLGLCVFVALASGCALAPRVEPAVAPVPSPPRVGLVLGGGAARGYAHIGVIKALEAQGIIPDIIVGTSAGSVVGALYAAGNSGFELQRLALATDDNSFADWSLPDRGILKGEALQKYVNAVVGGRPIERLKKMLAIVATDLQSGAEMVFRSGDTGLAVRASSSVPGLFQPVRIRGRDYVDGGLVSPVPVRAARRLGPEVIIAVDISSRPQLAKTESALDVLLQTFNIMGQALAGHELGFADVVVRPRLDGIGGTDFQAKHLSILEGEKALAAQLPRLREKLSAPGAGVAARP